MARLAAARDAGLLARRRLARRAAAWPPLSPGSLNAWVVLVTSKPPTWRDPMLAWREGPPTLGEAHDGFLHPDPIDFWAEVRRWLRTLLAGHGMEPWEVLAVSALVHLGHGVEGLDTVLAVARPHVVLYLDEAAWSVHEPAVVEVQRHAIPDPHRPGVVYEGWWASMPAGTVVGKSPQHPAAHRFYDSGDMDGFLATRPR